MLAAAYTALGPIAPLANYFFFAGFLGAGFFGAGGFEMTRVALPVEVTLFFWYVEVAVKATG